jgi:hypothetical protein
LGESRPVDPRLHASKSRPSHHYSAIGSLTEYSQPASVGANC